MCIHSQLRTYEIVIILPDSRTIGCRVKQSSENEEFCEAIDILLNLNKFFIARKEAAQTEFSQHSFKEKVAEKLRIPKTVRTAFADRETIGFCRLPGRTVRKKSRDTGIPSLEKGKVILAESTFFQFFTEISMMEVANSGGK